MADDDLQEKIRKFGEGGDSEPPESENERPSQVTIQWHVSKKKIKWPRTIAAALLAGGSIAELLLELFAKGGVISKLVELLSR